MPSAVSVEGVEDAELAGHNALSRDDCGAHRPGTWRPDEPLGAGTVPALVGVFCGWVASGARQMDAAIQRIL